MAVLAIQQAVFFDSSVYQAAKEGNLSKIKEFIQQGGWVDMPNNKGNSMLYYACKKGQINVVQYLMNSGAHHYNNLVGKDGLEKATKEVKELQKKIEESRNEKTNLVHHMNRILESKAVNFKSFKESLQFINSIPISSSREQTLTAYAQHVAFQSEEALSILSYLEGKDKTTVEKALVRAFLACGDIVSANSVVEQVTSKDGTGPSLKMQVKFFSIMYQKIEKRCQEYPSGFTKAIDDGLRLLNSLTGFPPETVASIIKGMSECNSFAKALEYANKLGKEHRGFARCGLSSSGLNELVIEAIKLVEKSKKSMIEEHLKKAQESKDFSEVLDAVAKMEDRDNYLYLEIGFVMCLVGKYEDAYQLINKHIQPSMEGFDDIMKEFTELLRSQSKDDWVEQFSKLTIKQV